MAIFRKKTDSFAAPQDADSVSRSTSEHQPSEEDLDAQIRERVVPIIDQLRPYLQADGGDVELVNIEKGVVFVRLRGACSGCPSSLYTLKMGLEARIVEEIPEVRAVEMAD